MSLFTFVFVESKEGVRDSLVDEVDTALQDHLGLAFSNVFVHCRVQTWKRKKNSLRMHWNMKALLRATLPSRTCVHALLPRLLPRWSNAPKAPLQNAIHGHRKRRSTSPSSLHSNSWAMLWSMHASSPWVSLHCLSSP